MAMLSKAVPRKAQRVLPGFGLTLGYSVVYLSLLVLIPLAGLFLKTAGMTWEEFSTIIFSPRVLAAYKISFGTAFIAAVINAFFGFLVAWVLVRYSFPGRRVACMINDTNLPSLAVAGKLGFVQYGAHDDMGTNLILLERPA